MDHADNDAPRRFRSLADLASLAEGNASGAAREADNARLSTDAAQRNNADPLLARLKLHVQLETKGRRGKGMTVASGFHHTEEDLQAFARALKTLCGAGGTVKDERIEVQGDHRETVAAYFRARGWTVILHR
jgi:translation initiation factor 1